MTAPNYLDHILNGALVIDDEVTVLYWNHWLEIQTGIKKCDIVGRCLYDYFPDINKKLIGRKLKQVSVLNTPAFISAETDKYLLKIPSRKIAGKIFDNMLQDVVISNYDRSDNTFLLMVYDQTSLFEARERLEASTRELEEQHILLQNTIDFQSNIIFVLDENKIINYNNNFLDLFGYDSVERINSGECDLLNFVLIEENEEIWPVYSSFYGFIEDSLNRNRVNKLSVLDRNGKKTVFLFSARMMPEQLGFVIVSMTDITLLQNREKVLQDINMELGRRYEAKNEELKKLNFDLARNRDQLRQAQEVASIGSFEYVCSGGAMFISDGLRSLLDDREHKVCELSDVLSYLTHEYRQAVADRIKSACDNENNFKMYAELTTDSGVLKPLTIHCRVFGHIAEERRLVITMSDLTNVKELEKQIHDKEQLVSSLFDVADIGFVLVDDKNMIARLNKAFTDMTGYTEAELVGSSVDTLSIRSYKSDYDQYVHAVSGCISEVALTHKDGSMRYAYMNVSNFSSDDSGGYRVIALTDITDRINLLSEQKEQEQLLIQQSKMASMGEMIGVIGHQWRQPLNSISLILDSIYTEMEETDIDREGVNKAVERCQEQIQFMSETINDFRSFFSHDTLVTKFDISETINNTVRLLTPLFAGNGTKINIHNGLNSTVYVTGISNEFRHTLLNMLSNAKDAIAEKASKDKNFRGLIEISISSDKESVHVNVCDNGGGIPDSVLEHIFKPYFTTKGDKGTGIGMYLAQIIITKKMHGSISAVNTAEGACICISIPCVSRS